MDGDNMNEALTSALDVKTMTRTLHSYIRSRLATGAKSLIKNLTQEEKHELTRPIEELGLQPAIFVAIRRKSQWFVKFLVNECKADINEEFLCMPNQGAASASLENATEPCLMSPLEFAIDTRQKDIAEFLSGIRADAKRLSRNKKALLMACEIGSFETVKLLADNGADLGISDSDGNTCLMKAVSSVQICRYLLDKGARVDSRNCSGETALHRAARYDCFNCAKLLIDRGANPFSTNTKGEDSLRLAAKNGAEEILNFLVRNFFKDVKREIESYQILGSHYVERGREMTEVLSAWAKAIALASRHKIPNVTARLPIPFGVAVEATSLSELRNMIGNHDEIYKQCIVLTHKHLGPSDGCFIAASIAIAKRYIMAGSFDRYCLQLTFCFLVNRKYAREFSLRRELFQTILDDVDCRIFDLISSKNVAVKPSPSFGAIFKFMKTVLEESTKYRYPEVPEPTETRIFIRLILRGMFLLFYTSCYKEERDRLLFQKLVCIAICVNPMSVNGRTILMEACLPEPCFVGQRIFSHASHLDCISMLLDCGANVNDRDQAGNTAAHILAEEFLRSNKRNKYSVRKIAAKLVKHGVHLDARNHQGKETTECLKELGIRIVPPINLMCSAARAMRRFNFSLQVLERLLPKFLVEFVDMH